MSSTGDSTVLIAFDGSEDAANAIALAGGLLRGRQAVVVHSFAPLSRLVLRSNVGLPGGPLGEAAEELDAAGSEAAERLAAEGAELAGRAGFEARPLAVPQDGSAWQALLATAEEQGAGVIVAGARGRSAIASALLGSVSNGLVQHSRVAILVVPATAVPGGGPPLLCYDGSDNARHAIARAAALLAAKEALVLHLWESWQARSPASVAALSGTVAGMTHELDEIAEGQSSELAEQGVGDAEKAGLEAKPLSVRGDRGVWHGILDTANRCEASLIVAGSRGLSGISAVLGSVSNGIVHHARRPVLIVPPELE